MRAWFFSIWQAFGFNQINLPSSFGSEVHPEFDITANVET
jgi:hypothetical protein